MPFFALPDVVLTGLSGGATTAVAIVGLAALTGLYLLKLQRRRVAVAFAPLWLALGGERRSQRWARRLRRWLSLLLQLAFLGLLLLAAADPRPVTADGAGRSVVVLIDRSASMAARDEDGGTRLRRACAVADQVLTGLGPTDRAMVVSFAADAVAETGWQADPAAARAGVASLKASTAAIPADEPGDLPRALAFVRAVLRDHPHPTLVLISDGAFSDDVRQNVRWNDDAADTNTSAGAAGPSLAGIDVRYHPVGRRRNNVAILSFAARRIPADPSSVETALVVQNFRPTPTTVTVEITSGSDDRPVERVRLELGAGQARRHQLRHVAAPDARLTARLVVDEGGGAPDDLAADDQAFAVVPGAARRRVLRVGGGDLFLDGALLSLGDAVDVHRVAAAAVESTRAAWPSYDAVIFDGIAPAPAPTGGRFLYLDPAGPGSPFAQRGSVREPIISERQSHHPLLRHVSLADVNIATARRLVAAPDDVVVAAALAEPMILARTRPGLRVVALAFDPRKSDLPMRTAFPLLLANSLSFLSDKIDAGGDGPSLAFRTGRTARVPAPTNATQVVVTAPDGQRQTLATTDGQIDLPVARAGFYRLADARSDSGAADAHRTVAANLGDAVESDTAPAATLTLGGRPLAPPESPRDGHRRPLWTWALLAAAALILFEWISYHRRWTI